MLTGLERFVRLVVERETLVPRTIAGPGLNISDEKSPKVFGLPKPYTGLYSASSYMANRPSYGLRSREPGNYGLNSSLNRSNDAPATYNANYKLPGLGGIPGENKNTTLPSGGGPGLLQMARSSSTLPTSTQNLSNQQFDSMIPDGMRQKLSGSLSQPQGVALGALPSEKGPSDQVLPTPSGIPSVAKTGDKPGLVTESITKTTFTETTVGNFSKNKHKSQIVNLGEKSNIHSSDRTDISSSVRGAPWVVNHWWRRPQLYTFWNRGAGTLYTNLDTLCTNLDIPHTNLD